MKARKPNFLQGSVAARARHHRVSETQLGARLTGLQAHRIVGSLGCRLTRVQAHWGVG